MEAPSKELNLKDFLEEVAGESVTNSRLVTTALAEVTWKDIGSWNVVKSHLQLVRSFSFMGAFTESDRKHIEDEHKKKKDQNDVS